MLERNAQEIQLRSFKFSHYYRWQNLHLSLRALNQTIISRLDISKAVKTKESLAFQVSSNFIVEKLQLKVY